MERIVLGVYDGPSGGAAVTRDGRLTTIAEEDRLLRRHRVSGLPRASVQTVLAQCGISGDGISAVVVATRNATYSEGAGATARLPLLYRVGTAVPSPPAVGRRIRDTFARERRRRLDEALRSEFGVSCPITFLDHHRVHAVAASAMTGRPDCLAVTMDAGADGVWVQVASVEEGHPRALMTESGSASLSGFLNVACDMLGLTEELDRMARLQQLADNGDPSLANRLLPHLGWRDGRMLLADTLFRRNGALAELVRSHRKEDAAAGAIAFTGEAARRFVHHWRAESAQDELVLGGDLFELLAVVRAVRADPDLSDALVPTAPGNVGLPVGCAYCGCLRDVFDEPSRPPARPLETPFVGTGYADEEFEATLRNEAMEYRSPPDLGRDVARFLAEGWSVARFHGKTEIGNRGLGNRAVLRTPRGALRRGRLGFLVAPAAFHVLVPEESFGDWFDDERTDPAWFRTAPGLTVPREAFAEECPALIRWEGSVHVQTVSRGATPELHEILREFETWTGIPLLAAAPFRLPDEPLVSSPRDAVRTFRLLGADFVALGSFLASNPGPHPAGLRGPESSRRPAAH